jgi:uncharacterized protein YjdB
VPVSGISFAQSSAEVELGKTLQLTAGISPMNATNRSIQWFSSDPSVVAVSDGLLSGKKLGTVTITAKTIDGGFTASLEVTVVEKVEDPTVHVSRVSLDKGSLNMKVGESATLKATVSPSNATNKGVTWTSSNNDVATVNSKGKIKAKAVGYAVITAKSNDTGATATCKVRVVYGVTGGLGFLLALVLMAGVRERLEFSKVPESMKGLPITLVSAGLIALAFMGFIGL